MAAVCVAAGLSVGRAEASGVDLPALRFEITTRDLELDPRVSGDLELTVFNEGFFRSLWRGRNIQAPGPHEGSARVGSGRRLLRTLWAGVGIHETRVSRAAGEARLVAGPDEAGDRRYEITLEPASLHVMVPPSAPLSGAYSLVLEGRGADGPVRGEVALVDVQGDPATVAALGGRAGDREAAASAVGRAAGELLVQVLYDGDDNRFIGALEAQAGCDRYFRAPVRR